MNKELPKEEKFHMSWPHDFHGFDREGHPVYYEKTSYLEPSVVLEQFTMEEVEELHAQMQEYMANLKQQVSKEKGVLVYKSIVIMDMSCLGMKHMSSSFFGPIKSILNIDQYYYPETMHKLYVINCPFVFRMMWNIVKPMLHPLTVAKINICGYDFITQLRSIMDDDQIPKYLGGSCSCCTSEPLEKQVPAKLAKLKQQRAARIKAAAESKS